MRGIRVAIEAHKTPQETAEGGKREKTFEKLKWKAQKAQRQTSQ